MRGTGKPSPFFISGRRGGVRWKECRAVQTPPQWLVRAACAGRVDAFGT